MTGAIGQDWRQQRGLRALFGVLVALVLLTRLLAPSGFMPVMTSQGVMVTLCTGQGAVRVMVARDLSPESRLSEGRIDRGDGSHDDGSGSTNDLTNDHCPFAGTAALPAFPAQDIVAILPVWHLPTGPIAFALKTGWIARLAAPPPPSSGPPATLD